MQKLISGDVVDNKNLSAVFSRFITQYKKEQNTTNSSVASHRPKGSMCIGCSKLLLLCNELNFSEMPVIGKDSDGTLVVRCTEYDKILEIIP